MFRWTLKTLLSQPGNLLASAGGVAGALILVIFFQAVFAGESRQIVAYIDHSDADVWVMQRGVSNMHMASSFIWDWKADKIDVMAGVEGVTPILYLNTAVRAGGRDWFSFVVGLRPGDEMGGPWALAAGRNVSGPGEAVIPAVIAEIAGLGIGGEVAITDKVLSVVGLSEGTFSMANSVAFVSFADLEDILSSGGTYSYLLVDAEDGVDPAELAVRIEAEVDKVHAMPRAAFRESDYKLAMHMGVEIIAFMTVIGSALAVLIIAFTAYSNVARRRRELAIIKALGVRNGAIYGSVLIQTLMVTGLGFAMAVLVAYGPLPYISVFVPMVTLDVTMDTIVRMGVVALFTALLAASIPAHLVARVDPMTAFKV